MRAMVKEHKGLMTLAEYVCGFARMLSPMIEDNQPAQAMLYHLGQVAEDASNFAWPAVRNWSEVGFDYVEEGDATWSDHALFASERMRLAWLQGRGACSQIWFSKAGRW